MLLVLAATGMCVLTQLWNPSSDVTYGFVIAPLVLSVVYRSVGISIGANVIIAIAWAVTWNLTGLTVTNHALLTHLLYVPILSIALSITQQRALRKLSAYHESLHERVQEPHDAMRLVAEETSLRAKSEAELRRQHSLLELILATVPDGIFLKDRNRNVLLANRALCDHNNMKLEEILGMPSEGATPRGMRNLSRETDEAVLRDGVHLRKEYVWENSDGTVQYWDVEKMPLLENSKIVGILGVARNITERKEAEKKLKEQEALMLHASRLSSMGELAAGIAHEINQPLYSILNYARAVKNTLDGPREPNLEDIGTWTGQILEEAARGGEISKRLRSFARRSETQREQASLSAIVQESIGFVAGEARSSNVEIQSDLADELPSVRVDRVQIQQVLVNLMKNAIEALQNHDVASRQIVISTRRVPEGVEVVVADNGPGLPADQTVDIIEPFFTTKNEGVGLGLSISNTIIEAHGSKLSCSTNAWGGATFEYTLAVCENQFSQNSTG